MDSNKPDPFDGSNKPDPFDGSLMDDPFDGSLMDKEGNVDMHFPCRYEAWVFGHCR
jgi:hypothetical protein